MPHLELDGGFRLYYERHGTGPAVLFAHGAGGNAMAWWQQVPVFRERFTTITFDHRAFGRSPDIEDGPGRIAFGADTLALLDHLEIERVHVIAHSMGGRTAAGLVRRCPERIASIVFSGTNGGCVDDRARARRSELEAEGFFSGSLLRRALAEQFYDDSPNMAFLYRQLRGINPPRRRDFLAPTPRMRRYRGSMARALVESELPLLWVVGERDRVVAPELIRIAHELTPGSRFHLVRSAGHSAYFEQSGDWNTAVIGFVDDVEAHEVQPLHRRHADHGG